MAHRDISRRCINSGAFEVNRTFSELRLYRRIYGYAPSLPLFMAPMCDSSILLHYPARIAARLSMALMTFAVNGFPVLLSIPSSESC